MLSAIKDLQRHSGLSLIASGRLRFAFAAGLVCVVLYIATFERLFLPDAAIGETPHQDYPAFFTAARIALGGGWAGLYDPDVFQSAIGIETNLLWLYPPSMFFLLAPFGGLSFGAFKVVLAGLTLCLAFFACRVATRSSGLAILSVFSPATFIVASFGQVGAFFALLLAGGLVSATRAPVLSGACFALLTIKPQYGLMVIPFLVAIRAWKAIAWATLFSLVIVGSSLLVHGPQIWIDFLQSALGGAAAEFHQSGGHVARITLFDAAAAVGIGRTAALAAYAPLLILAVAGVFAVARRASREVLVAYTLLATATVAPYFFVYDYLVVHAGLLVFALQAGRMGAWQSLVLAALVFVPLGPFIASYIPGTSAFVPAIVWLLIAVGTFAVWLAVDGQQDRHAASTAPFPFRSI